MKKIINKLSIFVCIILLIVSMTGCSTFLETPPPQQPSQEQTQPQPEDITLPTENPLKPQPLLQNQEVTFDATFGSVSDAQILSLKEAANKVKRSVVKITMSYQGTPISHASGVIVDVDILDKSDNSESRKANEYYIITCHHVISTPVDITVYVPDENSRNDGDKDYNENYIFKGKIGDMSKEHEVSLIGGDRNSDIAVLKLDIGDKNVQIVESSIPDQQTKVEYAEQVFSIGNPSGDLPMTFLSGNISYIDRIALIDSVGYMTLIQHDCLITHGNSGGALFNMKGQLIGITNAGSDAYKGMNYAIPFYGDNGFIKISEELIERHYTNPKNYGYVAGRWDLGIVIEESTGTVNDSKVKLTKVEEYSNSDGLLKQGDYIGKLSYVKSDKNYSYSITSHSSFVIAVMNARRDLSSPDGEISITYYRPDGKGYYSEGKADIKLKRQLIFCDTGVYLEAPSA